MMNQAKEIIAYTATEFGFSISKIEQIKKLSGFASRSAGRFLVVVNGDFTNLCSMADTLRGRMEGLGHGFINSCVAGVELHPVDADSCEVIVQLPGNR